MGRIPEHTIQEVRSRVDIVDLVGRYVELKRAGRNFKGLCPFHNEKTPSFNVNPDRQVFHCFGCGEGGDVVGFLIRHEGLTFPEALRSLARECGVDVPEEPGARASESEALWPALERAQELYRESLTGTEGEAAREYLGRRGLGPDEIARFELGLAPGRWDSLATLLARAGIAAEVGERAGLLVARRSGRGHYDLLRDRVVFPIRDARGRVVAFGGRALSDDDGAKYLNTPETPVFRKREAFYGLPDALEPIRRSGRVLVCEGYFDRIALARAGVGEALATCGTALTPDHARQLRRRTREVALVFDGDEAGLRATRKALEVLLPAGLRVRWISLPDGLDPDDLLARSGEAGLRAAVEDHRDALDALMRVEVARGCQTPSQKADRVGDLAPLVAAVSDPVERSEYARRLAVMTDSDPRAVEAVVRDTQSGSSARRRAREELEARPAARPAASVEERQLRLLAALLFQHPHLVSESLADTLQDLLPGGSWLSVIQALCDVVLEGDEEAVDWRRAAECLDEEAASRLHDVVVRGVETDDPIVPEALLEDLVSWFQRRLRDARGREVTRRLREGTADPMSLLAEKQRQLEEKRAAHGVARSPVS